MGPVTARSQRSRRSAHVERLAHWGWLGALAALACSAPPKLDCLDAGRFARPAAPIGFPGERLRGPVVLVGRAQDCFSTGLTAQVTVNDPSGVELPVELIGLQDDGAGFLEAVIDFLPRQPGPHFAQVTFEPNLGRGGAVFDVGTRGAFSLHRAAQVPLNSARCSSAAVFEGNRALCVTGGQVYELREDAGFVLRGSALELTGRGRRAWSFTQTTLTVWDDAPDGPRTDAPLSCDAGPCDTERLYSYVVPSSGAEAVLVSSERVLRLSDLAELIRLPPQSLKSSASWPDGAQEVLLALENEVLRLTVADGGVSRLPVDGSPAGAVPFGVWVTNGSTLNHFGFFPDGGLESLRISAPARVALVDRIHRQRDCAPTFAPTADEPSRGWVVRHDGTGLRLEAVPLISEPLLQACSRHVFAGSSQGGFEWLTREGP